MSTRTPQYYTRSTDEEFNTRNLYLSGAGLDQILITVEKLKVKEALEHIISMYPDVTMVVFNINGGWLYMNDDFETPSFKNSPSPVNITLLEEAADEAANSGLLPSAYHIDRI